MKNRATMVIWVVVIGKLISAVSLNQDLNLYWPSFLLFPATLKKLHLDVHIAPHDIQNAAKDFGGRHHFPPAAVVYPTSITDIQNVVRLVYMMGPYSKLTVAAKGFGHSLEGQAQAEDGIVINMQSFKGIQVHKESGKYTTPYVDVNGGELWIDVLRETLKAGLAPRSWTDYLYLTVGGTLSNAGISGQAFRHGPQINNVYHLQIVTGKGEIMNCSNDQNSELFYGALGGLGQFGIITKARIALEQAPEMVKWIRVLYSDFRAFTRDQEYLISKQDGPTFDYLEGFVALDKEGLLNNWRASLFTPQNPISLSTINTKGRVFYYLELTKNYNEKDRTNVEEEIRALLEPLSFIPSSVFTTDLPYMDFLDRVHAGEMKLRSKGLWEVPHPWLNLMIPKNKIAAFDKGVFKGILRNNSNGPIIIYPMNRKRWDDRMSAVTPDEDIFYLVALLQSAVSTHNLEYLLEQNERILSFCEKAGMGAKQYLSAHNTQDKWKKHFGFKWNKFVENKRKYDPHTILSPGQRIFRKSKAFSVL
ncbi:hypothetical protein SUGI_1059630 [Cryptomeria japonica]|nr:hypothetical protein SUGI_1059630 [Cryptomeria japonica]